MNLNTKVPMPSDQESYSESCADAASARVTPSRRRILSRRSLLFVGIAIGIAFLAMIVAQNLFFRSHPDGREEAWENDKYTIQVRGDQFHEEYGYYPTNSGEGLDSPLTDEYPAPSGDGIGDSCIVFSGSVRGNESAGLVEVGMLIDATRSSSVSGYGVAKNPGGYSGSSYVAHYVWYVDSSGEVHSWYDNNADGAVDGDEIDFVEGVYP